RAPETALRLLGHRRGGAADHLRSRGGRARREVLPPRPPYPAHLADIGRGLGLRSKHCFPFPRVSRYRHIFFDLDHTLWDFRTNSRAVLQDLYVAHDLHSLGVPDTAAFIAAYEEINAQLWARYEAGHMQRDVLRVLRFRNTLRLFGTRDDGLADRLGRDYLEWSPRRTALMPGVKALLDDLRPHYRLHIITNGFHAVQRTKITCAGIADLFEVVLTSEM